MYSTKVDRIERLYLKYPPFCTPAHNCLLVVESKNNRVSY